MADTRQAHLDEETWERLACRELTPLERDRALDHITRCAVCADVYRGVSMLEEEARAFDPAVPGTAVERAPMAWWQRRLMPYAAAAVLLLMIVALGVGVESLRRQNAQLTARLQEQRRAPGAEPAPARPNEDPRAQAARIAELEQTVTALTQPQANVPIVNLEPRDALRGTSRGGAQPIEIPADTSLVTVVLHVTTDSTDASYAVEILNSDQAVLWRRDGLRKTPYNTFSLVLPRQSLPAGVYRIRIYGVRAGKSELVEEYAVQMRYMP